MYDFLNAIGGMGFAILGAALTVGLCCVGSAKVSWVRPPPVWSARIPTRAPSA